MATPPMVGVPALVRWPLGPSSRMGWPIRMRVNQSMSRRVPTSETAMAMAAANRRRITRMLRSAQ